MLNKAVNDWSVPLIEEGRVKGLAEGQVGVVRRMAARRFGAVTAERLAGKLEQVRDVERMAEIGEWLFECDDGAELLDRVERLCAGAAGGDGPPP